jgi:hypothetical protein
MRVNRWLEKAAVLFPMLGFGILIFTLTSPGSKTQSQRLFYLPYQVNQEGQNALDHAKQYIKLNSKEVDQGIFENTLKIKCSDRKKMSQIAEIRLNFLSFTTWSVIDAQIASEDTHASYFTSTEVMQKGTNCSILFKKQPSVTSINSVSSNLILKIRSAGYVDIFACTQMSVEKPISPILWMLFANSRVGEEFCSLDGSFRYSEYGLPEYSKAQLLACTWGMGLEGSKTIYFLIGVAFVLWIIGVSFFLIKGSISNILFPKAVGCSLLFLSSCFILGIIFPPLHGPDESNHFLSFIKTSGHKSLEKDALDLANKGCFQRIHRNRNEKFTSASVMESRSEDWPYYAWISYPLNRSPLGKICWKALGKIIPNENASTAIISLRFANGIFVAFCIFLALSIAETIFKDKNIAPWLSLPVLLVPSVAYYSTVLSNYPFLIGGYVIQMIVLGILWSVSENESLLGRNFAKIGALLGLGISVSLCAADNSMVVLPFWVILVSAFFMNSELTQENNPFSSVKNMLYLIGFLSLVILLICSIVGVISPEHEFLPGKVMDVLNVKIGLANHTFQEGMIFIALYILLLFICVIFSLMIGKGFQKYKAAIYIRKIVIIGLISGLMWGFLTKHHSTPEIEHSKGMGTTAISYAVDVTGAFFRGFFPKKVDWGVVESFWRDLGWLETQLPYTEMEILRMGTGVGLLLLCCYSLGRKNSEGNSLLLAGSFIALVFCTASVGFLYHMVLYDVIGRYILVAYLFALVLASAGYSKLPCFKNASSLGVGNYSLFLPILAACFQSWSWVSVVNRYF